jgi:hypothetical protein
MKKQGIKKGCKKDSEKTTLFFLQAWLGSSNHFPHTLTFCSVPQPVQVGGVSLRSYRGR